MSGTVVSLLTPPGSGAIATIEVAGPRAWELARQHFRPAWGRPLPESPPFRRFWFGTFGGDEVVLAVTAADRVEVHCHGGRRVVRWVIEQMLPLAVLQPTCNAASGDPRPIGLLPFAPTLRTASILLDQHHGAFDRAVRHILSLLETNPAEAVEPLRRLASFTPIGRHLVEPWRVVVAGPPNVGKSSLVNALAGYQRSVVSETAGTTRDAVGVRLAFDGWPVELIDTAGLREAEGLEAEGVALAERVAAEADLVVWVMDASSSTEVWPSDEFYDAVPLPNTRWVVVMNKADRGLRRAPNVPPGAIDTSAVTGEGIPSLANWIVYRLIHDPPAPGDAVSYTPYLAGAVEAAHAARVSGQIDEAKELLRACLGPR